VVFHLAANPDVRAGSGKTNLINKLKRNPKELEILSDGTQRKPYLYIDDCIDGMLFALEHCHGRVNVLNLGSDSSTDVTSIAAMLVDAMGLTGVKFSYTGGERGLKGDVPQVRFDITKMKNLGWKPKYTSDEAIRKTVQKAVAGQSSTLSSWPEIKRGDEKWH